MQYRFAVYRIMGVLLYGAEAWVNKRVATRKLESFNNKCLRCILGITRAQQHAEHITSVEVRTRFGMEEALEDVVVAKRLCWAGHVARMEDSRLPKEICLVANPACRHCLSSVCHSVRGREASPIRWLSFKVHV